MTLACIAPMGDNVDGTFFTPRPPVSKAEAQLKLSEVSKSAWEEWEASGGEQCMKSCGKVDLGDRIYFQGFGIHKAPPSTDKIRRCVFMAFEPPGRTCDDVVLFHGTHREIWEKRAGPVAGERKRKSELLHKVMARRVK